MANIISFQMKVRGSRDQIDELYSFIPSDLQEDHREADENVVTEFVRGEANNDIIQNIRG